jgi:sulfide:quinone oxidoreductase
MGAGISGHVAATYARKWLPKEHEVVVVSPNSDWNYIPSNTWVSVGRMCKKEVLVPLEPIYQKSGIEYKQAKVVSIHPNGNEKSDKEYITIQYTNNDSGKKTEEITYDYLINATGPKFNYGATPGLGTDSSIGEHTVSICTAQDAENAYLRLQTVLQKAKQGKKQKILVGTSHGLCGCQAAALMYLLNIEDVAKKQGVLDRLDLIWITNESFLGDFGIGGLHMKKGGSIISSEAFTKKLFLKKNINSIVGAHVYEVESGKAKYELLDGSKGEVEFDLAMLLPQFVGAGITVIDKDNSDITNTLFAPNGFMLVDANYGDKHAESMKASDWPTTYQNPTYTNIFACGTAFAPPYPISKPLKSPNGTPIFPGVPRAGMPSSIMIASKIFCKFILSVFRLYQIIPRNILSIQPLGVCVHCQRH